MIKQNRARTQTEHKRRHTALWPKLADLITRTTTRTRTIRTRAVSRRQQWAAARFGSTMGFQQLKVRGVRRVSDDHFVFYFGRMRPPLSQTHRRHGSKFLAANLRHPL